MTPVTSPPGLRPGRPGPRSPRRGGALGHGGGGTPGVVPPRLLGPHLGVAVAAPRALTVLPLLALPLAVDMAVVARPPLLEQVGERSAKRIFLGLAQPELAGEL